jgi:hypothetical protein
MSTNDSFEWSAVTAAAGALDLLDADGRHYALCPRFAHVDLGGARMVEDRLDAPGSGLLTGPRVRQHYSPGEAVAYVSLLGERARLIAESSASHRDRLEAIEDALGDSGASLQEVAAHLVIGAATNQPVSTDLLSPQAVACQLPGVETDEDDDASFVVTFPDTTRIRIAPLPDETAAIKLLDELGMDAGEQIAPAGSAWAALAAGYALGVLHAGLRHQPARAAELEGLSAALTGARRLGLAGVPGPDAYLELIMRLGAKFPFPSPPRLARYNAVVSRAVRELLARGMQPAGAQDAETSVSHELAQGPLGVATGVGRLALRRRGDLDVGWMAFVPRPGRLVAGPVALHPATTGVVIAALERLAATPFGEQPVLRRTVHDLLVMPWRASVPSVVDALKARA